MSAFSPEIPALSRPVHGDVLARTVPAALRRTPSVAKIWSVSRLVIRGLLTAGFWPVRALQVRVSHTLIMQARQCELAADLLRHHLPADEGEILKEAADKVDVSHRERMLSVGLMIASLAALILWLSEHHFRHAAFRQWWLHGPASHDTLGWTAVGLLGLAYLVLIVQFNRQVVALQQFALAFNATCGDRAGTVDLPRLVWGVSLWHLVPGAVMTYFGFAWALPMMLAWAAFAMFARSSARTFRVQLAERTVAFTGVEPVVPTADVCPNVNCRNSIPIDAQFCPRCGTAV